MAENACEQLAENAWEKGMHPRLSYAGSSAPANARTKCGEPGQGHHAVC